MAPDIAHVTPCQPSDIRVPPLFISDPDVLNKNFPELLYDESLKQYSSMPGGCDRSIHNTWVDTAKFWPVKSYFKCEDENSEDEVELVRRESSSCKFEELNHSLSFLVESDESFLSDTLDRSKYSRQFEEEDDMIDPNNVLPTITDWWQISSSDVEEFDVVDVPRFGDSFGNNDLWDDVDTFVSVVDVNNDDVCDVTEDHVPVYHLDTRVTTVWGLDIIWEEQEE